MTLIAAGQILAPIFVELNKTHATNPLWPGHARFHLVWQVFSHSLSSALAVALIWWVNPCPPERFYIAALLLSAPLLSFIVALLSKSIYDGALHDANGVRPLSFEIAGRRVRFELNYPLVIVGLFLLLAAIHSFRVA